MGFVAVQWLLALIIGHTFPVFAWYRVALGIVILLIIKLLAPAPRLLNRPR